MTWLRLVLQHLEGLMCLGRGRAPNLVPQALPGPFRIHRLRWALLLLRLVL